jgi:tetratricopeptide (TPR) repeat protein
VLKLLEQSQKEIANLAQLLDEGERGAMGTPQRWTTKDHLAHLSEWNRRMASSLSGVDEAFFPDDGNINEENAAIYAKYQAWSWDQVLELAQSALKGLVDHTQQMSEEDLASITRLSWQGQRPIWRLILGNGYTHTLLHLGYIYKDRQDRDEALRLAEESSQSLLELDVSPNWQGVTLYNLACNYAALGEPAKSINFLSQALSLEPGLIEFSKQDNDLAGVRDDPQVQDFYQKAQGAPGA